MVSVSATILSRHVLEDVVTREVNALLAHECARAILEGLADHPEGLTDRQISADLVGSSSTEKTVIATRKKFTVAGWIAEARGPPNPGARSRKGRPASRWKLTPSGLEARDLARASDRVPLPYSTRNGGVGAH